MGYAAKTQTLSTKQNTQSPLAPNNQVDFRATWLWCSLIGAHKASHQQRVDTGRHKRSTLRTIHTVPRIRLSGWIQSNPHITHIIHKDAPSSNIARNQFLHANNLIGVVALARVCNVATVCKETKTCWDHHPGLGQGHPGHLPCSANVCNIHDGTQKTRLATQIGSHPNPHPTHVCTLPRLHSKAVSPLV